MWQKLVNIHGGKQRPLFIALHVGLSAVTLYFAQQYFSLEFIFQLILSIISNFSYILTAYSNPGYILHKPLKKQQTSIGLRNSSRNSEGQEERVEALESGNSEFPEEKYKNLPELPDILEESQDKESFNSERNNVRKSYDFKGSLTASPQKRMFKMERISMPRLEGKYEENSQRNDEFMPRFCLVCNVDQPVRAKHCRVCHKCVHRWDHHCTWLGNCIGEKNYLYYILYLNLQSAELLFSLYSLISYMHLSPFKPLSIALLAVLSPTLVFSLFLTFIHYYLITKNRTMAECISWKKIYYLTGKTESPFDFGTLNNVLLFCTVPKTRDWNKVFKIFSVINK